MKTIAVEEAVAMIPDGARLKIGGFMGVGTLSAWLMRSSGKESAISLSSQMTPPNRGQASANSSVQNWYNV